MVLILTGPIFQQLCKASVRACPGHRFLKVTADARQGQGLPSPLAVLSIIFWMSLKQNKLFEPTLSNESANSLMPLPGKGKVSLPPWLFCQLFSGCHYIPSQARPILNQNYPKKVQSARQGQGLPSPWLSNYVAHPCFYMKQFLWIDRKHRLKADDEAHGRKAQKVQISSERAEGPLVILEYSFLWAQRPFVSLFPPQPTNLARFGPKMGL